MQFWEAMKALEQGKKVRSVTWPKIQWVSKEDMADAFGRSSEDEWELYEEPVQSLSWLEVVKGLKEGKSYRRQGWDKNRFANSDDEILMHGTEILGITELFLEDFEANDWIEVKDESCSTLL